jgi:hypothetical protein
MWSALNFGSCFKQASCALAVHSRALGEASVRYRIPTPTPVQAPGTSSMGEGLCRLTNVLSGTGEGWLRQSSHLCRPHLKTTNMADVTKSSMRRAFCAPRILEDLGGYGMTWYTCKVACCGHCQDIGFPSRLRCQAFNWTHAMSRPEANESEKDAHSCQTLSAETRGRQHMPTTTNRL